MRRTIRVSTMERLLRWATAGVFSMTLVACGGGGAVNGGLSDQTRTSSNNGPSVAGLTLVAGATGGPGSVDGNGASARFYDPQAIATDVDGNLYVADTSNHTIRKITPSGAVTTLAGKAGSYGSADGNGPTARFSSPSGITSDAAGNLYVADTLNHTIRKVTPAGVVTTLAGMAGVAGSADGTGSVARFNSPFGIKADSAGNLFVADTNNLTIRKITPAGVVTTFAGTADVVGSADGSGADARFSGPHGITVDPSGNIYVTDTEHFPQPIGSGHNSTIRKITASGVVTTLAGTPGVYGSADGVGAAAQFNEPQGITADSVGNLYVADTYNGTIRKITPAGAVSTFAGTVGSGSADGNGAAARFSYPSGITSDANGNLYVADTSNSTIRKITSSGSVSTFAGAAVQSGSADGAGSSARFAGPFGITVDQAGFLYVADSYNATIRKISPTGFVSTFAGTAGVEGNANGSGAAAQFSGPSGITIDASGNLYVAETANRLIRKITPSGIVSTLAGSGQYGSADGPGTSAQFSALSGIAVDKSNNLYVADTNNNTIRKITPGGVVSTLAGKAQVIGSADGIGANATFQAPAGIAIDTAGNLYVADTYNHTVRKISLTGMVTTLAGTAGVSGNDDGQGAAARFFYPKGITVDAGGNVYVGDSLNHTIRKITASGMVSTVAGVANQQGIVLGGLPGGLSSPQGLVSIGSKTLAITTGAGVVQLDMP